jgi:hypothetical protein
LLASFTQVCSEICEQKAEQKGFKNLQLAQKRSTCNVGDKESLTAEEIRVTKKKPGTFCGDNREDTLRTSQQLARPLAEARV